MDFLTASIFVLALTTVYLLVDRFLMPSGKSKAPDHFRTRFVPTLYLDQLDKRTKARTKRFELNDSILNHEGYIISGSRSKKLPRTGLKLSAVCPEAETVCESHAIVYKEDDSYFIRRNTELEHALMKLSGVPEWKDLIRLEDKMIVYLGEQPLQFLFVNNNYTWEAGDQASADNNPDVRTKPRRRNKPGAAR